MKTRKYCRYPVFDFGIAGVSRSARRKAERSRSEQIRGIFLNHAELADN